MESAFKTFITASKSLIPVASSFFLLSRLSSLELQLQLQLQSAPEVPIEVPLLDSWLLQSMTIYFAHTRMRRVAQPHPE
jgi:hypothetical protein